MKKTLDRPGTPAAPTVRPPRNGPTQRQRSGAVRPASNGWAGAAVGRRTRKSAARCREVMVRPGVERADASVAESGSGCNGSRKQVVVHFEKVAGTNAFQT